MRIALVVLLLAAALGGSEGAERKTMAEFSYQHGRLLYRKRSTGFVRGREDFWLTRNRDGTRTLRSIAMTDDSKFVRDVTFTLSADERPADIFIRLQVDDRLVGTGYFRTEGDRMRIVVDAGETGHTEQVVPIPPRFHVTTHAVMLDAWPFWAYDRGRGGEQTITVYNTSTRWNGTDGPLGRIEPLRLRFVTEEDVTVPAGTLRCRLYHLDTDTVEVPLSKIWVTGEDNLMVRYDWGELDLEYVLGSWVKE
jgi:hypothetical protein